MDTITRRRLLVCVAAAPPLRLAVHLVDAVATPAGAAPADAAAGSAGAAPAGAATVGITDIVDFTDALTLAALPTQHLLVVEVTTASGYCQPGQIMAAAALLAAIPHPADADIDTIENVCRCGTYVRIRRAVHRAADSTP